MILKEQRKANSMNNKNMDHFINWRFGVPVIVKGDSGYIKEGLLIHENESTFTLNGSNPYSKLTYHYELIPHKNYLAAFSPRYPVCQSPARAAYCNSGLGDEPQMNQIDSCDINDLLPYPTATLTIDGKTIELSAETTAELKKKLGV